jgi:hypothetical protein
VYVRARLFVLSAQIVLLHIPECGMRLMSEYKGAMPVHMLSYHVTYQTMLGMHSPFFKHAELCGCMGAAMSVCLVPVQTCAHARTEIYACAYVYAYVDWVCIVHAWCVCVCVRCTAKRAGNNWRWTWSDGLDRNCKCTRSQYVYQSRPRAHVDEF